MRTQRPTHLRGQQLAGLVLASILIFTAQAAFAKELHYKDYPLDLRDGDRLVLIGIKGTVHLESAPPSGASTLASLMRVKKVISDKSSAADQASYEALSFNVRRDGNQVIIEQKSTEGLTTFDNPGPGRARPELDYEIAAPVAPAELVFRDGSVLVRNWKQSLSIQVVNGNVTTTQTEGALRIQIQRGEVHVTDHRGRLDVDSFAAKVALKNVEGDVDLQNFSGSSTLSEMTGGIDVRSSGGGVSIAKSSGAVDFLTGHGALALEDFSGPVRGTADQGSVSASLVGDVEVHIDSNQGSVNLKLPTDSGASVRLSTEDGSMNAPESIKAAAGRAKILSGRLKGEGPKGTVVVKNKSGASRVRI